MKKKILVFILVGLIVLLTSCGIDKKDSIDVNNKRTVRLTTSNMPSSIPLFYMQENNVLGEDIKLEVSIHKTGQEAIAKIVKNDIDMAYFGVQEAAKLYNKGINLRLINVSTWSTFEILTTKSDIKSWEDLVGKKVWLGDKAGPIDFLTQIVLNKKGIDVKNIDICRISTAELAQMAANELKDMDAFILREPFVSQVKQKNDKVCTLFNLGDEYEKLFKVKAPQSGIVGTNNFISGSPEVLKLFQSEYEKAIEWVQQHPEQASEIGTKYLEGLSQPILLQALKSTDMTLVKIHNAKEALEEYYKHSVEIDSVILENKLPDANFYTEIENR